MWNSITYYKQNLHQYYNHTVLGLIEEGMPSLLQSVKSLTNGVALNILAQVGISSMLFYLHHNLFTLGFIAGFVYDNQFKEVEKKVNEVYMKQQTSLQQVLFFGGGAFIAILTMPASIAIASLYDSARWGALLSESRLSNNQAQPQPKSQEVAEAPK